MGVQDAVEDRERIRGLRLRRRPGPRSSQDRARPSSANGSADVDHRRAGHRDRGRAQARAAPRACGAGRGRARRARARACPARRRASALLRPRTKHVAAVGRPERPRELELGEAEEPCRAGGDQSSRAWPCRSGRSAGSEYFDGLIGTVGLSISPRRSISLSHWLGLEDRGVGRVGAARAARCAEADVDVVVVVGERERVVSALVGPQADDLARASSTPLSCSRRRIVMSAIPPSCWLPRIGMPLIAATSTARPYQWSETRPPPATNLECPHFSARDGRAQTRAGQVLEDDQDALVDQAALDVLAAAVVDVDARVGEDRAAELLLGHQQHLADGDRLLVQERVLARRPVDRRRLEQLPAVEDRLGVDRRRALSPAGWMREADVRRLALLGHAHAAEDRTGHDLRALAQRLELDVVAAEAEDLGEVGAVGLEVRACRSSPRPGRDRRCGRRWAASGWRTGAPWSPRPAAARRRPWSAGRRRPWPRAPAGRARARRWAPARAAEAGAWAWGPWAGSARRGSGRWVTLRSLGAG